MITQLPRPGTILVTVGFVLVSVVLTLVVWRSVGGPAPLQPQGYRFHALFDNAGQLTRNADVRIAGVDVGSVVDVRAQGVRTRATLEITSRYAPLPRDVRAILRQKTLLGETFVALTPGSARAPRLRDGGTLPVAQVEDTQPLDRVLGMLDRPTRERLAALLTNTGTLLDGRGADVNDALGNLAVGARQLDATVRILDRQRGDVQRLVRDAGAVLQTVGDERAAVGELARSGRRALASTARRDRELTATVQAAPAFLRELRASARALSATAVDAGPVLRRFRPIAPRVAPALAAARDAAPRLRRVLEGVEALAPLARRALPAAAGIVGGMSPLVSALEPAAREVLPVISYTSLFRDELVATMANVSAATNGTSPGTDGRPAPYLRTLTMFGEETVVGASSRQGGNRHNAYRRPGGLAGLADGLESASCAHAEEGGSAPACKLQDGWSFAGGPARYFQHVLPAGVPAGAAAKARRGAGGVESAALARALRAARRLM